MYTSTTRTVLGEFSEQQYSLSPSYQIARLLVCKEYSSIHFSRLKEDHDKMETLRTI